MKQYCSFLMLAVLALVLTAAGDLWGTVGAQNRYRLAITVISEDFSEPVEGASVTTRYMYSKSSEPIRLETQNTGTDGKVWIIPAAMGGLLKVNAKPGDRFDIDIKHPEYFDAYRPVVIRSDTPQGDIPVTVSLKRKAGAKSVSIEVRSKGDRAPVYGATVKLIATNTSTQFSGTTDASGRTRISVTEGGDYDIVVEHRSYEPVRSSLTVKMFDDQREYPVSLEIKLKREAKQSLRVYVKGKDKDGKTVPVRYAQVTLPDGQMKTTDYEGVVQFGHQLPPGEEVRVQAEATYYKPGYGTFVVGTRLLRFDTVTINLEREDQDEPPPGNCSPDAAAAFSKMKGSFKSYRMHITIAGSCDEVSGTYKVAEWCVGVDEPSSAGITVTGSFTGKMQGSTLFLSYDQPASPNGHPARKGTGSCSLGGDGTFSCSGFGCMNKFK